MEYFAKARVALGTRVSSEPRVLHNQGLDKLNVNTQRQYGALLCRARRSEDRRGARVSEVHFKRADRHRLVLGTRLESMSQVRAVLTGLVPSVTQGLILILFQKA